MYEESIETGNAAELKFSKLFKNLVKSDKFQDKIEHWDFGLFQNLGLNNQKYIKFEVKALKKVHRDDADVSTEFNYVELKGVTGHDGWLYGKADYFAFEHKDTFIIVEKYTLQKLIKKNIIDEYVQEPILYKKYLRPNRLDVTVLVKNSDLIAISKYILKQKD